MILWTVSHQAPLSRGFSGKEYWSGLPFPSPGDLPNPGIEHESPALEADALPSEPRGKSLVFLPGEVHGQRSLVGYSPWGHKQLDMAERLTLSHMYIIHKTTYVVLGFKKSRHVINMIFFVGLFLLEVKVLLKHKSVRSFQIVSLFCF